MKKIKKYIIRYLSKIIQIDKKYPYVFKNKLYKVDFFICNPVEEFRIKNWGGEKEYVISLAETLAPEDIFYDIGSSIGLNSIIAAKKINKGKVISFEPDPENLDKLEKNYKLNKLTNYQIVNFAVGDAKNKLKLYTAGSNGFSPSLQKVNGIDSFIEVNVDSIDNLIKKGIIPLPDIVKVDVEGAELMVLRGMKNLLMGPVAPRKIFLELHSDFITAFGGSVSDVYSFFENIPYSYKNLYYRGPHTLIRLDHD